MKEGSNPAGVDGETVKVQASRQTWCKAVYSGLLYVSGELYVSWRHGRRKQQGVTHEPLLSARGCKQTVPILSRSPADALER